MSTVRILSTARSQIGALLEDTAFPRTARLLNASDFSALFRLRPRARSPHFVLYGRRTGESARLGFVMGRKQAPRSVTRSTVRHVARDIFRLQRTTLFGWDVLIRLHTRFDKKQFISASSPTLKKACREEILQLLERVQQPALSK